MQVNRGKFLKINEEFYKTDVDAPVVWNDGMLSFVSSKGFLTLIPLNKIQFAQVCEGIEEDEADELAKSLIKDAAMFNYADTLGYDMSTQPDAIRSIAELLKEVPKSITDKSSVNIIVTHKNIIK